MASSEKVTGGLKLTEDGILNWGEKATLSPGTSDHNKGGGQRWGRYIASALCVTGWLLAFYPHKVFDQLILNLSS